MSEWIKRLAEKYSEVNENQKAAMAKKLAKASASSEKGKAAVTLPKAPFEIPESIPANERTAFHGAAAGAHKAGKTSFTFQGKKYPVTMKKDTAQAIADEVKESTKLDEGSYDRAAYGKGDAYDRSEAHEEAARDHEMEAEKHEKARRFTAADLHTAAAKAHQKAADSFSRIHAKRERSGGGGALNTIKSRDAHAASVKANSHYDSQNEDKMTGRSKVKPTMENDDEVVMNPKKEKKQKGSDAEMAQESTIYSRILEARKMKATADKGGEHTKSATDQEEMGDKQASSKGAMDMMNTPKEIKDNPEASGDEVKKAADAAPKAAMRKGDNAAGDKKVIPSATPTKGM